jgi:hypothetical protein
VPRKRIYKRCGGSEHIARTCKNAVDASFREDQHWGVENAEEATQVDPSTVVAEPKPEPEPSNVAFFPRKNFVFYLLCVMYMCYTVCFLYRKKKKNRGKEVVASTSTDSLAKNKKRLFANLM